MICAIVLTHIGNTKLNSTRLAVQQHILNTSIHEGNLTVCLLLPLWCKNYPQTPMLTLQLRANEKAHTENHVIQFKQYTQI